MAETNVNLVLCGLGGQGILFMTRILAQTALRNGSNVLGAETHGMAQRGGSVVSHLRIGASRSSLVRSGTAQCLLALDETEAYRNLPFLARGGKLYVNAPSRDFPRTEVREYLGELGIATRSVEADRLAMSLKAPRSSNLALLGFFAAFADNSFRAGELRDTIEQISPERFREFNLRVFEAGRAQGAGQQV